MSTADTRERILDAAERLFSESGYAATSMRGITRVADVNLAAVNYHFGSKVSLLVEVVRRRVIPMNVGRMERLDALEQEANGVALRLEDILRAFIDPVFMLCRERPSGNHPFLRLIGRLYSEPVEELNAMYEEIFGDVFKRYAAALSRALPTVSPTEVFWRIQFVIGMLVHVLMAGDRISLATGALCEFQDIDRIVDRMVEFAAAGLRQAQEGSH